MSHVDVKFEGQDAERASVLALVEWFGFRKSLGILRHFRNLQAWWQANCEADGAEAKIVSAINGATFAIEMGGVSGFPVRSLVKSYMGEDLYQKWMAS